MRGPSILLMPAALLVGCGYSTGFDLPSEGVRTVAVKVAGNNTFRQRLENGESLDDLLPEAFATVREATKRTLGMRHHDVQLIGGVVLHRGWISEMKTGEGKTLVAPHAAYLNGITGEWVHNVTVNE